jgi:hypothetical protein
MDARRRELRVAIGVVVALGLLVMLAIWVRGEGAVGEVRGRALGEVERVALVDAVRGVVRDATLEPDGRYRAAVPRAAKSPAIVLHGPGGSLVESGPLALSDGVAEVRSLAVWHTPVRIRRRGEGWRLDWAPIPEGPGFPEARRYSVLLGYARPDGDRRETTLLGFDPQLEIAHQELLDLLKERDPALRELDVSLRAFDPREEHGPLWVGCRRTWDLERGDPEE